MLGFIDYTDWSLWDYEKSFVQVLNSMEQNGVSIDSELAASEIKVGTSIMDGIVQDLDGLKPSSPKDLEELLIQRLGLPVFKTSPKTGKPSFDKYAMEDYELALSFRNDDSAQKILEYRGWQKAITTYFTSFLDRVGKDGRLRTRLNQIGRASCRERV